MSPSRSARSVRLTRQHSFAGLMAVVAATLGVGARPCSPPAVVARAATIREAPPAVRPLDIEALSREAYLWGWPLAYVHQCRARVALVPRAGKSGGLPVAPLNELAMLTDQVAPRTPFVPCPNRDVLYGFGVFDLAATPVVVQVPDFGDRFWLYQLGDQRTDSFGDLGSMYGTRPGCYLVVGPDWAGTPPRGIAGVLRSPTRHAYCIPRVFLTAAAGDRDAAVTACTGVMAYPLDDFTGALRRCDWKQLGWLPGLSREGKTVTPDRFLEILPHLLDDVPPLPGEESLYARLRTLVAAAAADPAVAAVATAALQQAERDVVAPLFEFRNVGLPLSAGWTTVVNGAAFGTDYLTRTAVARSNVFVNRHHETKYYYLDVDVMGRRLDGSQGYVITFPPGSLPPAAGFWSLTAYDARHSLPVDSAARHSIGTRDQSLVFAADGSLTIVVEPAGGPGAAAMRSATGTSAANRIVAPPGPFSLYLRLYAPLASALEGDWTPPPVEPWRPLASA